ncbi:MAG: hypothetical protein J0L92_34370 [Deltaproteobacteria bacterium]|nr:hypothetical protein [Deltaproteobacteria bacterium]
MTTSSTSTRDPLTRARVLLLAIALGGCNYRGGVPPLPTGADDPVLTPVFREDGSLVDPRGDADGDGIPNQDEVDGYTITVDVNGFGVVLGTGVLAESLEVRRVTSDPRLRDSDADGLDDREERMFTSDPRRQDSDGDTLLDVDEVRRWATSPVSIDTDGDARGGDPDNPRPPQFALFDAAELRLVPDVDPTAPYVPGFGATSPRDPDTDGDGLNDYEELHSGTRRSTVAEVPLLHVRMTPGSQFSMGWNVTTTEETVDSRTYTTTFDSEEAFHTSTMTSTSSRLYHELAAGVRTDTTITVGCCADIASVETEVGAYLRTENRFEQSFTFDVRSGFSTDLMHTNQEVLAAERSMSLERTSGNLRLSVDVENVGVVPFRASDIAFAVLFVGPGRVGALLPLTELAYDGEVVLAPGERQSLVFSRNDIEIEPMSQIMRDPTRIILRPARANLTNRDGQDFDFQLAEVRDRAAHFTIDFGDRIVERDVAALEFQSGRASTVGQLLSEAGIDYAATALPTGSAIEYAITIEGRETVLHAGAPPDLDEALPYTARSGFGGPGPRVVKHGWFAQILRRDASTARGEFFGNLFDAPVRPGDVVNLVYSEDLDRDGLPAIEEAMYGSSDLDTHSDDDGLSDYWEIREGWVVNWVGAPAYGASPNPTSNDSDEDGVSDLDEARAGTDPLLQDTDEDGLTDLQERDGRYGFDPLGGVEDPADPVVTCRATQEATGSGPPGCYVSLWPEEVNFPNTYARRATLPCSAFVPSTHLGVPIVSDGRYSLPAEVFDAFVAGTSTEVTDRRLPPSGMGGYIQYDVTVPSPPSSYCRVLLQYANAREAANAHDWRVSTIVSYEVLPCSAFTEIDGYCQLLDSTLSTDAARSGHHFFDGSPGPGCHEIVSPYAPFQRYHIEARDPQGDLTNLRIDRAGAPELMEYAFGETGVYERDEIARSCTLLPETLTVTVRDRYGFEASAPCAWEEGHACLE